MKIPSKPSSMEKMLKCRWDTFKKLELSRIEKEEQNCISGMEESFVNKTITSKWSLHFFLNSSALYVYFFVITGFDVEL